MRGGGGGGGPSDPGNSPFRYWSVQMVGSGLAARTAMAQFVATFSGGASPTITASETLAGTDVDNLSDGLQTTYWATDGDYTDARLYLDLGEGVAETLTKIAIQQTDEADGDDAHPAAVIIGYSSVGGVDPEDYIHYCVLLTQVSGASADLVEYAVSTAAQNGDDFYGLQPVWGFIVNSAGTAEKMADTQWQDAAGSALGTVDSHYATSAVLVPASLYDDNPATETGFEVRTQPQLLATVFTASIAPVKLELTGAAAAADSWTSFYLIAGPDDGCMQIVSEVERVWTDGEVVVIDPRQPKDVKNNAVVLLLPGDWSAAQWDDTALSGGVDRSIVQATGANQPTPNASPTRLSFVNTGGTREWMEKIFTAVSARSQLTIFKRPTANWVGTSDGSGAPTGTETKISGDSGTVKTLGEYGGALFGDREDFFESGVGWGVDPEADDLTTDAWCASLSTAVSASSLTALAAARFEDGGATVDMALVVIFGDTDVSKNGPWKQLQRYAERVIDELEAS